MRNDAGGTTARLWRGASVGYKMTAEIFKSRWNYVKIPLPAAGW